MACGRRWWTSGEDQVAAAEEIIAAEAASAMAETASVMAVVIVASRVAWMPVRAHPCAHHCRARCYPSAETDPFAQTGLGRTDPFAETDHLFSYSYFSYLFVEHCEYIWTFRCAESPSAAWTRFLV